MIPITIPDNSIFGNRSRLIYQHFSMIVKPVKVLLLLYTNSHNLSLHKIKLFTTFKNPLRLLFIYIYIN